MELFSKFWESLTWNKIGLSAIVFLFSMGLSALIVGIIIVKIPENYFSSHYQQDFLPNTPWLARWSVVIIKNIVGVVLVLAGIIMLIGPGQGILTILIGLIMIDIPGKRPLEARIIKRPMVLAAINNLRARYKKPPLVLD